MQPQLEGYLSLRLEADRCCWNNKVSIKKVGLGLDWVEYMLRMLQIVAICSFLFLMFLAPIE